MNHSPLIIQPPLEAFTNPEALEGIKDLIRFAHSLGAAPKIAGVIAGAERVTKKGPFEIQYQEKFHKNLKITSSLEYVFNTKDREVIAMKLLEENQDKNEEESEIIYIGGIPHKDGKPFDILSA